jgi:hypothetical protein
VSGQKCSSLSSSLSPRWSAVRSLNYAWARHLFLRVQQAGEYARRVTGVAEVAGHDGSTNTTAPEVVARPSAPASAILVKLVSKGKSITLRLSRAFMQHATGGALPV